MTATHKTTAKPAEEEAKKKPAARRKAPAKTEAAEAEVSAVETEEAVQKGDFIYAIGRRKTATAQTKLWSTGEGVITVNGKPSAEYFPRFELQEALVAPLKAVGHDGKVTVTVKVTGGGIRGQAEATRLGISRALLLINPDYRKTLKAMGFLTRDSRKVERKKYGLRKARKASQWAKR